VIKVSGVTLSQPLKFPPLDVFRNYLSAWNYAKKKWLFQSGKSCLFALQELEKVAREQLEMNREFNCGKHGVLLRIGKTQP
jgi:hypothetical protein